MDFTHAVGFIAGFGTTVAAVPDLLTMLKRRSSTGMNPRMAAVLACFQVVWVYYGHLIGSAPIMRWNIIAVVINTVTVAAYFHFSRAESRQL
ncbi:SemiSWEET family transporter [Dyella sp. C9]|uniref:SemiSWEET family transporter n=1 Tax=Dyella sp. C9 TaxID=2202154 RepID=UPI000DEFDB50|nr:SemiSWEET family transporter [Dyella sp. C9]